MFTLMLNAVMFTLMLNAECSRIQSLPNWTLKGTGCPKASGRLSPTNNNNNNDDPIFMKEALLSIHRQIPFKSTTHATILFSFLPDLLSGLPQTLLVVTHQRGSDSDPQTLSDPLPSTHALPSKHIY